MGILSILLDILDVISYVNSYSNAHDDNNQRPVIVPAHDLPLRGTPVRITGSRQLDILAQAVSGSIYWNENSGKGKNDVGKIGWDISFSFTPDREYLDTAAAAGRKLQLAPIAKEALIFTVKDRNRVKSLTVEQLRKVYSGAITDWSEVGGDKGRIEAYQRREGSPSFIWMRRFTDGMPMAKPPKEPVLSVARNAAYASDYNFPQAINYSLRHFIHNKIDSSAHLLGLKALWVNGIPPSCECIADGSYPLTDDVFMITTEDSHPDSHLIVNWMRSPQGQRLLLDNGYVPILPVE